MGLEGLGLDVGPIVVEALGLGVLEGDGHMGMEGLVAQFLLEFEGAAAEAGKRGLERAERGIWLGGNEEHPFTEPVETGEIQVYRAKAFEKSPQVLREFILLGFVPMKGHFDGDVGWGFQRIFEVEFFLQLQFQCSSLFLERAFGHEGEEIFADRFCHLTQI